ncbi:MAG: relaxase domain-containing protein [Verrucomicrobiaceae bacterium]|nr:relaxase domain-containing protein [Verrucomicrobiaceae bacterium]
MLRVISHKSAAAARQYYAEGLKREDYYTEKQEVVGKWNGKAAVQLGLTGNVTPEAFGALVENRHPVGGGRLTPNTKSGRIVGYDLNFHAPKSLSVLYAMTQDEGVLRAFRQAVQDTMAELEEGTATRVRTRGQSSDRVTGNLAWAEFVHFTARPVGGIPDPHLHVHCFAFNATFDETEGKWKAAKFRDIKRNAPYSEAAFHARLTSALSAQGYHIERTKNGWELKGMPASVIAKFSRRTAQIERLAAEKGIIDAKEKETLGALTREGKRHGLTFPDLMAAWSVRLTDDEKVSISKVCYDKGQTKVVKVTAVEAVDFAISKLFERQSVVERERILAEAMRYGVGHVTPQAIKAEFERRELVGRKIGDEHLCTSVDVLAEEVALINFVRSGRNSAPSLGIRASVRGNLSDEQELAVAHILTSRDQVIAVRGAAGVGKTTLMKEAVAAIEAKGTKVFAFAPSASASRETMREEGFAGAETVAHLLHNTKLQKQVQGQVIWIDEAGLLGVRDMWRIMQIAGPNTRVILTGDTAQHAPVARGDAFRLLQQHAGLRVAEVTEIRRQQVEDYKAAIASLSKGDLRTGFRRLEKLGALVEIEDDAERYRELARDFVALAKRGGVPLVVSPTHAESAKVTSAIRAELREAKRLGAGRTFLQFHNLQWQEAERGRPENFQEGLVVQYHQNAKGVKRGELFRVVGRDDDGSVKVKSASGVERVLSMRDAAKFQVFEEKELSLAKGDRVRITRNGVSENGRRLNNGNVFTVEKIDKKGRIVLNTGAVLKPDHGHLAYGYCQTSHSSQSKSVKDVLVAQSEASFLASSREQLYVSCSRGKETIRIYTDNIRGLQQAVGNSSTRMSGVELAGFKTKDISSLMSTELNATKWREAVQRQRGSEETRSAVKRLIDQRREHTRGTDNVISWRGYIELKRSLAGPDGKSRSKGHPGGKPKSGTKEKGKSWPKAIQVSTPVRDKMLALSDEKKQGKTAKPQAAKKADGGTRQARFKEVYQGAAKSFGKIADKVKGEKQSATAERKIRMGKTEVKPLQKSNSGAAVKHAVRVKAEDGGRKREQQAKMAKQVQAAPRPAPRK